MGNVFLIKLILNEFKSSWYWSVPLFAVIATILLPGGSTKNRPAKVAEKPIVENDTKTPTEQEENLLKKDE